MMYPTLDMVEAASHFQLAGWHRYLSGPGASAVCQDNFADVLRREGAILDSIEVRFNEMGGMTPAISKSIGWQEDRG